MDGFTLPKEFDDFVTSASDLLSQYKQNGAADSPKDFLVFRIFFDDEIVHQKTLNDYLRMRKEVLEVIEPMMGGYVWHKDSLRIKVIIPEDNSVTYLGGILEFGDCVDDEWFVVSLLYEVSRRFPEARASVTDTDGQFLLIEASAVDIPEWIGPENSDNRVWIKDGQLHIIPLDEAGKRRSGGIDVPSALAAMRTSPSDSSRNSTLASHVVQQVIMARVVPALAKNKAQLHQAAVTVPLKVAKLLAVRPELLSAAVTGLCTTERSKQTNKVISSMSYFGTSPLVTVSVPFTRALYAQITFQERFHPPPKFLNAQRVLQKKLERDCEEKGTSGASWDAAASKAFDVGCRIACGLEIHYQQALGEEKKWHGKRLNREGQVHSQLMARGFDCEGDSSLEQHIVTSVPSADFSAESIISCSVEEEQNVPSVSRGGVELLNSFRSPLSCSEVVNLTLVEPQLPMASRAVDMTKIDTSPFRPQKLVTECENVSITRPIDDISIVEVSPDTTDSDHWLYLTPDEFDANMQSRIATATATTAATPPMATVSNNDTNIVVDIDSDDDADASDLWKNHSPSPTKARSSGDADSNNMETLTNIVTGMDNFMASYSDYSGVSKLEDEADDINEKEGSESDDEDNISDEKIGDDYDQEDNPQAAELEKSNNNDSDDIEFDSGKLINILKAQGLDSADMVFDMDSDVINTASKVDVDNAAIGVESIDMSKLSVEDQYNSNTLKGDVKGASCANVHVQLDEVDNDDRDSFYDSSNDSDDYDSDNGIEQDEKEEKYNDEASSGDKESDCDDEEHKNNYMEAYLVSYKNL